MLHLLIPLFSSFNHTERHNRNEHMGEYWMYACVDKKTGCVILRLNPQRGFGGMKWGEYIGTDKGDAMLKLLNTKFCPDGAVWGLVSDYGNRLFTNLSDDIFLLKIVPFEVNLSQKADDLEDIGLHPWLREEALVENLTTPVIIELCDRNLPDMKKLHAFSGATSRPFDPPDLPWFGLKKPQAVGGLKVAQ